MPISDYHVVGDASLARPVPTPPVDADNVIYDNATSGMTASNVQDALDELSQSGGGGSIDTKTVTFTEASTRTNIASGETVSTLFGKIKKWFTDLKTVAFTGSYTDLTNKPTIPSAQVNSDWNASSGVAKILNKPTIPSLVGAQNTTGTVKNGSSVTSSSGYTACPIISGVPYYKDTNTTTGTSYNAGSCPDNTTFATNGSVARAYSALNSKLTWISESDTSTNLYCNYLKIGDYSIVFLTQTIKNFAITGTYGNLYFNDHTMNLSPLNLPIASWENITTSVIAGQGLVNCSVMSYNNSQIKFYITDSRSETVNVVLQVIGIFKNS